HGHGLRPGSRRGRPSAGLAGRRSSHLVLGLSSVAEGHGEMDDNELSRRAFMGVMGAGLVACSRGPRVPIVPYGVQPPEVHPGIARYYASSSVHEGFGCGVLVESHEGHPTKLEGNPLHPASLGASCAIDQAAVRGLYDPDRARWIREGNAPRTWDAFARTFSHAGT